MASYICVQSPVQDALEYDYPLPVEKMDCGARKIRFVEGPHTGHSGTQYATRLTASTVRYDAYCDECDVLVESGT